jgi:hypothetical protein
VSSVSCLSCLVLSCLVLSCLVLPCCVLSCLVLSCLSCDCLVLPCLVCHMLSCVVFFRKSYVELDHNYVHSYFFLACIVLPRLYCVVLCLRHVLIVCGGVVLDCHVVLSCADDSFLVVYRQMAIYCDGEADDFLGLVLSCLFPILSFLVLPYHV